MSYILDALRKSEQQRRRGAAPLLFTTQISSNVEKQPASLFYGLVATILICVGILIGWLRPWQPLETAHVKDNIAISQHEAKPLPIAPTRQILPSEPEKSRKSELLLPVQKSISTIKLASESDIMRQVAPTPSKEAEQPRKSLTSTAKPQAPEQMVHETVMPTIEKVMPSSIESNGANGSTNTAPEQKIIAMTELPLTIQQEIPIMTISGYAYSSIPKERSVGINERLLQEGEYLAPGIRLEQITTDGLVFSYKKYLFRHSL
jgi:general secretion pathway protein B